MTIAPPTSKTKHSRARRSLVNLVVTGLLSVVIGTVMAEGLLRTLVPRPIFYSTWFSADAHQPDAELGFVFRPDYVGAMRHADHVWIEPIALNEFGMRQSAVVGPPESSAPSQAKRIVMLGGASMAFSYGLSDQESLHHRVASRIDQTCQIDLISWPGFNLAQEVAKLPRISDPEEYQVAVLFAYALADYQPREQPLMFHRPATFHWVDSVVVPSDPVAQWMGEPYYASQVVAGLGRTIQIPKRWFAMHPARQDSRSFEPDLDSPPNETNQPWVYAIARHLQRQGIPRVLIVALPAQSVVLGPIDLPPIEEAGIDILDLRHELTGQTKRFHWIAAGHYGAGAVDHLAERIAGAL